MSKVTQLAVGTSNRKYNLDINEQTEVFEEDYPEMFESETEDVKAIIQGFIAKYSAIICLHLSVDIDEYEIEDVELIRIIDQADNEIPTSEIPEIIHSYIETIMGDYEKYDSDIIDDYFDDFDDDFDNGQ